MSSFGDTLLSSWRWAAATVAFLGLVALFWDRGPGLDRDDYGLYLMHAEAMVEGRPYTDVGFIATPLDAAPPLQPPGLPLIVAGAIAATGGFHWWAVKAAMVMVALVAVLLPSLYFARLYGRPIGLALMGFLTVLWAPIATNVESDLGFVALCWAACLLYDRDHTFTWPRVGLALLLASFAMTFRFIGAALVPAAALFAVFNAHRVGRRVWAPVAVWGAGGVAVLLAGGGGLVMSQLALDNPGYLLRVAGRRLMTYGRAAAEAHLYPLPGDLPNDLFHAASLLLALVGTAVWAVTGRRSFAVAFVGCYVVLLSLVWAEAGRYMLPLYPVVVVGLLLAIKLTFDRLRPMWPAHRSEVVAAAVAAAIVAAGLVPVLREPKSGGYLHELDDAQALFTYLRTEAATSDPRVAFAKPRVLAWNTDVPAMITTGAPPDLAMQEWERLGITHVIVDNLNLERRRTAATRESISAQSCRFEHAYENPSFEVYRILPECPAPASPGAGAP